MQRRGANGRFVKGQHTKKPAMARKASAAHLCTDHPQEQLLERLRRERDEAIELQAASAEVLKIIGSSPRDMKPVFEAMLVNALRICDAKFGHILLYDGERFHATHLYDVPPSYRAFWNQHGPIRPGPKTGLSRLARTKQVVHIPDLKADSTYTERAEPLRVVTVEEAGARSFLAVPMLKENKLAGAIVIYRAEVRPFSDKQIELVKNFAAQAVIAMENARLVAETREALEQQTATAEVLRVINSSPGNLAPVFDAILEKAHGLCAVTYGSLQLYDGNEFRAVAVHGLSEAFEERLRQGYVPGPNHQSRRLMEGERFAHTPDMSVIDDPISRAAFEHSGIRTALFIPLRKEGRLIGQIVAARREVRPFNQKEIALLENFAAQAVVALENARLFNETKEALARQTATADVLKVIASSPSNLQPVFDAIAERSKALIGAHSTTVVRYVDGMMELASFTPVSPEADAVLRAMFPMRPIAGDPQTEQILRGEIARISDAESEILLPAMKDMARARGWRSRLLVPLNDETGVIGWISIARKEAGAFADKDAELLLTFAGQAVIAIQNVRLFEEVQTKTRDLEESLQQQTATADVLKVISRSAFDLEAVLNTLVESAVTLSGGSLGTIFQRRGDLFHLTAAHGYTPEMLAYGRANPLAPGLGSNVGRTAMTGTVVQFPDVMADPDYTALGYQRVGNFRAMLGIPIMREGKVEGVFSLAKPEPGLFGPRQVELVQTFADQAIIAIENARLFEEVQARTRDLQESLQQQTAMADVLKVISRSAFDLQPVFDTVAESSAKLCEADRAFIYRFDGELLRMAAAYNAPAEFERWVAQNPIRPGRHSGSARAALERRTIHIHDVRADPEYTFGAKDAEAIRTVLGVPILKGEELLGVMMIYHLNEVKPFAERQIALVETFADQAAIAIENVRLFHEVQKRTDDLAESLRQQTATAEVLKTISRSTFDLPAVLHALVETAARLCNADKGTITRQKDGVFYRAESVGFSEEFMDYVRGVPVVVDRHSATGRALLEGVVVHIPDVEADRDYSFREGQRLGDFRSLLGVPMLREGVPIGVITLTRTEPSAFTPKQIELAMTFADQAAIAIENVRLFDEVQARTRELAKSLDDLRTAQDRLVQTEKLASLGQLTAGIAHEIKNPLNFVNNFSALSAELVGEMKDALSDINLDKNKREELDEIAQLLRDNLEKVVQHGKRADSIVKNMLQHSREGSGEHRPADINAIVDESLNLAYHGARAEKAGFSIAFQRDLDPSVGMADVYPQEITRVLLNLISNGFYAATKRKVEAGDGFEPILSATTKNLGDKVEIRIRDNGTGIPEEVKEKIFNPFFTTKPSGEGTGLGLSMSHDIIVKQHGGSIDVETKPGLFTEFKVVLPRMSKG